jgi:uncharacterized protein with PIN domain
MRRCPKCAARIAHSRCDGEIERDKRGNRRRTWCSECAEHRRAADRGEAFAAVTAFTDETGGAHVHLTRRNGQE